MSHSGNPGANGVSYRGVFQDYGEILNHQAERVTYAQSDKAGSGFDNTPTQPHAMPTWVSQTGPAGSCLINWTMLWHTRSPSRGTVDRDVIWQIYRRPNQPCGGRALPVDALWVTVAIQERNDESYRGANWKRLGQVRGGASIIRLPRGQPS